jgi:nicotinamidase-related amidase
MFESQRVVLIPIDMRQAFDLLGRPRRWNAELDRNGLALLTAWRARKLPIIHVTNSSANPGSCFYSSRPGHRLRPGFAPLEGEELVDKSVNSAFIGTDLDARLRRRGADEIVLLGMRTDMCVSSTARSGANLGWRVTVVGDACDCCDLTEAFGTGRISAEEAHRVHLATLADEFARVVTTAKACAMLQRLAPSS